MMSGNEKILEEYLALRSISEATKGVYEKAVSSWSTSNIPLTDMDAKSIENWYLNVKGDLAPNSIVKYGTTLRIIYTHLLEKQGLSKREADSKAKELFDVIPFKELRQSGKKQNKLRDKLVTPKEFKRLVNGTSSIRTKALLAVTYESGCRKGEVFSIRIKDILQRETHWALRVSGKTGERTVPIVNSIPYLKAWLQIHPSPRDENQYLFVNDRSGEIKPLSPNGFNVTLSKLCEKLGIRRIYPHMLRHTRLTRLAEDGLAEYQMKSFAGWVSDSDMAAKYIHLTGTSHVDAVLNTQGVHTEVGETRVVQPFIKLDACPNCGKEIDGSMVVCPYCQLVLREKVGISQEQKMKELEDKVDMLQKMFDEIYREKMAKG